LCLGVVSSVRLPHRAFSRSGERSLEKDYRVDFVVQAFQHIAPVWIYLLLAVFLFLESTGVPSLNTTVLLCTGALAALGRLNIWLLMIVAIVSSVLGACAAYGLGWRYGGQFLLDVARFLHVDKQKISLIAGRFQKAGGRMIFFSRIIPYIRPFACFPAGISAMPFIRFLLASIAGSTVWCVVFLLIGWKLGPSWKLALQMLRLYTLPTLTILLALLIAYFFSKRAITRLLKKRLAMHRE
jgi:membrane protein DedA with SNARE-associated domain